VLKAMGFDNDGALRVSIGSGTTTKDIDLFAAALSQILARRAGRTTKAA
jgi:cysteine desulfurase